MINKMEGQLSKIEDSWVVLHCHGKFGNPIWDTYQLHPDDVNEIIDLSKRFDNIEARIATYPIVEFEIVENEKMSGVVKYAKLIKDDFSEWDVTLNDGLDETT